MVTMGAAAEGPGAMSDSRELLATMAVVAAGALLGRVQFRGVRLDVTAMLLFGALVAHVGVILSPVLGTFGLLLFLYTVGVQTGPALRRMHRRDMRMAGLAMGIVAILFGATMLGAWLLEVPVRTALGVFAGFFGSGAALAVIEGHQAGTGASAGFAVAAPLSAVLVLLVVQAWREASRPGIEAEIQAWNTEMSRSGHRTETLEVVVENPDVIGRPLRSLRLPILLWWVQRDGVSLPVDGDTVLEQGDVVRAAFPAEDWEAEVRRLGRIVPAISARRDEGVVVRKFLVSNPESIDVRLEDLRLRERFGATVTRIRRAGMDLRPRAGFRFRWGDRIQVSVPANRVEDLRNLLGDDIRGLEETAFPRAALVIFLGGMIGAVPLHLGGIGSVRLGTALGVLTASVVTAALHRTGPLVWTQSGPTSRLMAHIALPLFLAQIGNTAYSGLMAAWGEFGTRLVLLSLCPILLGALLVALAGRWFGYGALTTLSMLPSLALNTPALTIIQKAHREAIPGHVYAAVYPIVAIGLLLSMFLVSLVI